MVENSEKVIEVSKVHLGQGESVRSGKVNLQDFDKKPVAMPDSPFEGFRMGANCDMRVRLAIEILTHSPMFAPGKDAAGTPEETALFALDTATYLLDTAFERGLIKPFGEVSKDAHLLAHMHRQIEWQIVSTKATQKAQEEASRIQTYSHRAFNQ